VAQKLSAKTVERRMKERRALELRMAGASYEWIAQEVGWSGRSGAWYAVQRAMKRLGPAPVAEELRELIYLRLERLLMAVWPKATSASPDYRAQDRALSILQQLRMMMGVDLPKSVDVDITLYDDPLEGATFDELYKIAKAAETLEGFSEEDRQWLLSEGFRGEGAGETGGD